MARYGQWRLQFLDENGRLRPNYRPAPLAAYAQRHEMKWDAVSVKP